MASFKTITDALTPFLGFYIVGTRRFAPISRSFAINQEVFGLEVVVGDSNSKTDNYSPNCHTTNYETPIYLTQHEGGLNSIDEAVETLKGLTYQVRVKWVTLKKQDNIRRAVVTLCSNCICD